MKEIEEYEPYDPKEHIFYDSKQKTVTVRGSIDLDLKDIASFRGAKTLILEDGVRTVRNSHSYYGCDNITAVELPKSLKKIGIGAFNRTRIKNIDLPSSLESIGSDAFHCCEQLKTISLPDNIKTIGHGAFSGCDKLTSVSLPRNLENIERSAFNNCRMLKEITIPDTIQRIESHAFEGCVRLEEITIPDGIYFLGEEVFKNCDALKCIRLSESAKELFWYAFCDLTDTELLVHEDPEVLPQQEIKSLDLHTVYPESEIDCTLPAIRFVSEELDYELPIDIDDPHFERYPCGYQNYPCRVAYISDLHLDVKLLKHFPQGYTSEQLHTYLYTVCDRLVRSINRTIDFVMFLGDISYDLHVNKAFFEVFSKMFRKHAERFEEIYYILEDCPIYYVLGNHELWGVNCKGSTVDAIVDEYRTTLAEYQVTVLQNELVLVDRRSYSPPEIIGTEQLLSMSDSELRLKCIDMNAIMLCGTGFSAKCPTFNAKNDIYRSTLDYEGDVEQTNLFFSLHEKCRGALAQMPLMVFTHTAVKDWGEAQVCSTWTYFHGHTHHNNIISDQYSRIFSDAQVGYESERYRFKIARSIPVPHPFTYLGDGVYEISYSDYQDFNSSMNISVNLKKAGIITMLKKSGYYLFILTADGENYLLEGGKRKPTDFPISYFFDRMEDYANNISQFMEQFHQVMGKLSKVVRSIGGSGYIHGCIVDIDYFNHLYVNPVDWTVTPYYATSMRNKWVYRNLPSLLADQTPALYSNYRKMLEAGSSNLPALPSKLDDDPQYVDSTDMYSNSRMLRCYQYSSDNHIIRNWSPSIAEKGATIKVEIKDDRLFFYGDGVGKITMNEAEVQTIDLRKGMIKYLSGPQNTSEQNISAFSEQYCKFAIECMSEFQKLFDSFRYKLKYFNYAKPASAEVLFSKLERAAFPADLYPEFMEALEQYSKTGTISYMEIPNTIIVPDYCGEEDVRTYFIDRLYNRLWVLLLPWNHYRGIPFDYSAALEMVNDAYRKQYNSEPSQSMETAFTDNLHLLVESFDSLLEMITPYVNQTAFMTTSDQDEHFMPTKHDVAKITSQYTGDASHYQGLLALDLVRFNRLLSLRYASMAIREAVRFAFKNLSSRWSHDIVDEETIDLLTQYSVYRIAQRCPVVYLVYGTLLPAAVKEFVCTLANDSKKCKRFVNTKDV